MSTFAGVRAQIVELGRRDQSLRRCASASATQTARQSRRRVCSEKSERSSARPYLHENGEAYVAVVHGIRCAVRLTGSRGLVTVLHRR